MLKNKSQMILTFFNRVSHSFPKKLTATRWDKAEHLVHKIQCVDDWKLLPIAGQKAAQKAHLCGLIPCKLGPTKYLRPVNSNQLGVVLAAVCLRAITMA